MHHTSNKSIIGTVLAVVILAGLLIFYFAGRDGRMTNDVQNENRSDITVTENQDASPDSSDTSMIQSEAELEAEIESFDSDFSDMNSEDLDI